MNTFNPTQTSVKFLKEWTPTQFKAMDKAIARHLSQRVYLTTQTSGEKTKHRIYNCFSQIDRLLGLAYTSTGIWACYGVCNCAPYFDEDCIYQYSYFTIGEDNNFYAVLQDREENELTIAL